MLPRASEKALAGYTWPANSPPLA